MIIRTTFFVFVILQHPSIINYSFSLFMCVPMEDGYYYLRQDTEIKCWHGNDFLMQISIGVPMIAFWAFVFPGMIYLKIKSLKLNDAENLKSYGIFYIGFSDETFYWEVVVMNIRKIFLIMCATFLSFTHQSFKVIFLLNYFQGYLGIIALFIQRHLSHFQQPFIDPRFNTIEDLASFASVSHFIT